MNNAETVETLQKSLEIWLRFERMVRRLSPPDVTDEEVYHKTKDAMNLAITTALEGRGSSH